MGKEEHAKDQKVKLICSTLKSDRDKNRTLLNLKKL